MSVHGVSRNNVEVVGGSSNKQLASEIAEELGLKCGKVTLGRYADGEVMVRLDEHIRGKGDDEEQWLMCSMKLMLSTAKDARRPRIGLNFKREKQFHPRQFEGMGDR